MVYIILNTMKYNIVFRDLEFLKINFNNYQEDYVTVF